MTTSSKTEFVIAADVCNDPSVVKWKQMYTILVTCLSLWMGTIAAGVAGFWAYMGNHQSSPHDGVVRISELDRIDSRFARIELKLDSISDKIILVMGKQHVHKAP